jgi:thiol-disulfide isomerase/thioredoxin
MGIQSMVTATVLTAVCLLGAPLPGHGADESKIGTSMTLADAGDAAPNFVGIKTWLNSAPLNIADLRGKVVLVDFWTYGCYNCVNTLPHVTRLYDTYKDKGLIVIGIHTPEFAFEKSTDAVQAAIKRHGIRIRWRKTTNMQRGTLTTTNIGQRSISSTEVGRSCSSMPVRVITKRLNERYKSSSTSTAEGDDRVLTCDDARKDRRK